MTVPPPAKKTSSNPSLTCDILYKTIKNKMIICVVCRYKVPGLVTGLLAHTQQAEWNYAMTSHTFCPSVWSNFTEGSSCGRLPRGREPVVSRLCEVFSAALEPCASLCDTAAQRLHSGVTQLHILTAKDPLKATVLVAQCLSWLKGTVCPFHRKSHAGCDCIWTERRDFLHR